MSATPPAPPTYAATAATSNTAAPGDRRTPACIVLGMAGAGKTTLMQRLNAFSRQAGKPSYLVNLDPAVMHVPYEPQIDIRDTVDYKELMQQYQLGPNGGIMTALNLFVTKFDKVLGLMEKRAAEVDYLLCDTPGQIEVFTWSASGDIVTKMLASSFPTVLVYVIDTPRCTSPATFMSNMLYASSIFYKAQMPMVVVFNKVDVASHQFAVDWMQDFEAFQEALEMEKDESYMSSLLRSMSMLLDEFYAVFECVGVSAATGEGVGDFFAAVDRAAARFDEEVRPRMEAQAEKNRAAEVAEREKRREQMEADMTRDRAAAGLGPRGSGAGPLPVLSHLASKARADAAAGVPGGSATGAAPGRKVTLSHDAARGRASKARHLADLNADLVDAGAGHGGDRSGRSDDSMFAEGELLTELEGENDEDAQREEAEYSSLMKFVKQTAAESASKNGSANDAALSAIAGSALSTIKEEK